MHGQIVSWKDVPLSSLARRPDNRTTYWGILIPEVDLVIAAQHSDLCNYTFAPVGRIRAFKRVPGLELKIRTEVDVPDELVEWAVRLVEVTERLNGLYDSLDAIVNPHYLQWVEDERPED